MTHAYDVASPLPALAIDPRTGRAVGVITSGRQLAHAAGRTSGASSVRAGGGRALGWGDGQGWGGDNQRSEASESPYGSGDPLLWAAPTAYTYYDPHSPPSAGAATPPWTFNPLVATPPPRGAAHADADGGDGAAAAVGDEGTHAGGGGGGGGGRGGGGGGGDNAIRFGHAIGCWNAIGSRGGDATGGVLGVGAAAQIAHH